jgi:hypothetical protein
LYHEILVEISKLFFVFIYFGENLIVRHLLLCVVTVLSSLLFVRLMAKNHNTKEEEED